MKAAVYRKNEGLVIEDVPLPRMDHDQVLLRVANTGFCGSDHSLIESGGLNDGYILGHEVSGIVAGIGKGAQGVVEGGRMVVRPTFCGTCIDCNAGRTYFCQTGRRSIGIGDLPGAFAEYLAVYPGMLIPVPDGVDSRNAALAEVYATSLHAVERSGLRGGSALVIGGGPVGLTMVRLLKLMNFGPVVLSEPVAFKRDLGRVQGADQVVDPTAEDILQAAFQCTRGQGFDIVFECSGSPNVIQSGLDAAARGGMVCIVSIMFQEAHVVPMTFNFKEVSLTGSYSNTHEENRRILKWMAEGKLDGRSMITDLVPLEALPSVYRRRIDTGEAVKVMLAIGEEF